MRRRTLSIFQGAKYNVPTATEKEI
jgi:hypothetical protein